MIFPLDQEFLSYDLAGNLSKFTPDFFCDFEVHFLRVITFMSSELQSSGFVEISVATLAGASNCAFIHMHFIYLFFFFQRLIGGKFWDEGYLLYGNILEVNVDVVV